jgi:hypothetical protein
MPACQVTSEQVADVVPRNARRSRWRRRRTVPEGVVVGRGDPLDEEDEEAVPEVIFLFFAGIM